MTIPGLAAAGRVRRGGRSMATTFVLAPGGPWPDHDGPVASGSRAAASFARDAIDPTLPRRAPRRGDPSSPARGRDDDRRERRDGLRLDAVV